jgi:hypothetical protein
VSFDNRGGGVSVWVKAGVFASVVALIALVFALRAIPKAERPTTTHVITYVITTPASPTT